MTGWGQRRSQRPDPGVEYDANDSLFDVVEWRKGNQQERNGQAHQRVYDPQLHKRLGDMLEVLERIERHMAIITGEEDI